MSESKEPQAASPTASAEVSPRPGQPLLVSILSILVIALTASLFRWLKVPSEVTATLAAASGALIPAIAIRGHDRQQSKQAKVHEVVSGDFQRPFVYVFFIAAGLLVLAEFIAVLIAEGAVYSFGGEAGVDPGSSSLLWSFLPGVITLVIVAALAVAVGYYVAHRRVRYDFWCAIGAAVLGSVLLLSSTTTDSSSAAADISFGLGILIFPVLGVVLGVLRGRRTRPVFLANRLFKGLSESDRAAVLEIMAEAQAGGRLAS